MLNRQRQQSRRSLPVIGELGFVPLSPTGAELLFEVFRQRCESGSILVATGLPFDEWTAVFGAKRLTGALLDRLTPPRPHPGDERQSYRLKRSRESAASQASDGPAPLNQSNAIHPPLGFLHRTPCMPSIIIPAGHDYSAPVAQLLAALDRPSTVST